MEEMKNLSQDVLLDLLVEYDNYIQQANDEDDYSTGWRPVCVSEFYTNEYQLILEEREENVNK